MTSKVLGAVIVLWGVGSLLAAAFQCSVPMVWQLTGSTCFNIVSFPTDIIRIGHFCLKTIKRAFSISFDAINILTELALVVWPTIVIVRLHASKKRRIVFIAAFGCRVLYAPFDRWCEEHLTDPIQRDHCMYCPNGLRCPGSRRERLDIRLMAPDNLYGDRAVSQSYDGVHTIPPTVSVELGVWIAMERRLPTSEY